MNYRNCFRCGGILEKKSEQLFICASCGFEFYTNPKPCNGVIIENKNGEILLVKRGVNPKKGWWDTPGGFTNVGETMEESVRRELMEEIHLDAPNLTYLTSVVGDYEFMGEVYDLLIFIYVVKLNEEHKIEVDDDVSGYQYFKKSEIPYERFAFPDMIPVIKNYIKNH